MCFVNTSNSLKQPLSLSLNFGGPLGRATSSKLPLEICKLFVELHDFPLSQSSLSSHHCGMVFSRQRVPRLPVVLRPHGL